MHTWAKAVEGYSLTMREALIADNEAGTIKEDRPWYHNTFRQAFIFSDHLTPHCPYCKNQGLLTQQCPQPHACCHLTISCIIPTDHHAYGANCPHANVDITDNNNGGVCKTSWQRQRWRVLTLKHGCCSGWLRLRMPGQRQKIVSERRW